VSLGEVEEPDAAGLGKERGTVGQGRGDLAPGQRDG